jgi:hypothetical protein
VLFHFDFGGNLLDDFAVLGDIVAPLLTNQRLILLSIWRDRN